MKSVPNLAEIRLFHAESAHREDEKEERRYYTGRDETQHWYEIRKYR